MAPSHQASTLVHWSYDNEPWHHDAPPVADLALHRRPRRTRYSRRARAVVLYLLGWAAPRPRGRHFA